MRGRRASTLIVSGSQRHIGGVAGAATADTDGTTYITAIEQEHELLWLLLLVIDTEDEVANPSMKKLH
jgi:hypothetical protein